MNNTLIPAQADIGIAIGYYSDVAKETGKITLIKDDIMDVPQNNSIKQAIMKKIKQNLF